MAHAANISELANGLIISITGRADDRRLKHTVLKGMRDSSHARTNQFAIKARLDGLVEKFAVLDRDDLANGLECCLNDLPSTGKFLPEILALLLELSDRPVEKRRVDAPEEKEVAEAKAAEITWKEIIQDDPLEEDGLWDDIERGYHSSCDELDSVDENATDQDPSTTDSRSEQQTVEVLARKCLSQPNEQMLGQVFATQRQQSQVDAVEKTETTELTLVRESIFMLLGHQTALYHTDVVSGRVTVKHATNLNRTSLLAIRDVLIQLAEFGTGINYLRKWTQTAQLASHSRTCQTSILEHLRYLDRTLVSIEERFVTPMYDVTVSILDVSTQVQHLAGPTMALSRTIHMANSEKASRTTFAMLDSLFAEACMAQMVGDAPTFETLAETFSQAAMTYLRPVAEWISTGRINEAAGDFFIIDHDPDCDAGEIWHKRFAIRRLPNGSVSAPSFMYEFVDRLFAMGKTKTLMHFVRKEYRSESISQTMPDLFEVVQRLHSSPLLPFPQLFKDALEAWLDADPGSVVPQTLHNMLLTDCKLADQIDALSLIYTSKDCSSFNSFAETVLARIDAGSRTVWPDSFLLTEIVRTSLGSAPKVVQDNLSALFKLDGHPESIIEGLGALTVTYVVSWPVQTIIRQRSPVLHSRILAFLLQIHRAKTLLQDSFLDLRSMAKRSSDTTSSQVLRFRQRMVSIVDVLFDHVTTTSEVLASGMHREIANASDIDSMAAIYLNFEKRLALATMLLPNLAPIRDSITKLLILSEGLSDICKSVMTHPPSLKTSDTRDDSGSRAGHRAALTHLEKQYDKEKSFVSSGLRSVSRAGGETSLDLLVERLQWDGSEVG